MDAIKTNLNSSPLNIKNVKPNNNAYERHYRFDSLVNTPNTKYKGKTLMISKTPSNVLGQYNRSNHDIAKLGNQEMFRDEVKRLIHHLEGMTTKDFAELSLSFKSDLNKLSQLILKKQNALF